VLFKAKILLLGIFLISLLPGKSHFLPLTPFEEPQLNSIHWKFPGSNTALFSNKIEIDIFNWQIITKDVSSLKLEIKFPAWESIGIAPQNMEIPEPIQISPIQWHKNTPVVNIQIIPWRIEKGRLEFLSQGELEIHYDTAEFSEYFHPFLLDTPHTHVNRRAESTQYLIITSETFLSTAQNLADMHTNEVESGFELITEVITVESLGHLITGDDIRNFIQSQIHLKPDLKFLLLFGDENDIPPIYYNNDYPSDDFYSTPSGDNIFSGNPQLASGRIPVSTLQEAENIVENIRSYTLNPIPGIWRSRMGLVADDMYRSCAFNDSEFSHTTNSDNIYDSLIPFLPVTTFYGVQYVLQQVPSGCAYPNLTRDIIHNLNSGLAMINYIGHGDSETWAGEKLITKSRDLQLIQPEENKFPIWIAGTCSFGKYYGENSFMESLLLETGGAIAVVATTDAVGYTENSNYLNNLFGITSTAGIRQFVEDSHNYRLGEIVRLAKNNAFYKFHTFGDPALRLPFPKKDDALIKSYPESISLIEDHTLEVENISVSSTLLVEAQEKEINFGEDSTLFFSSPGVNFAKVHFEDGNACFRVPLDAGYCSDCTASLRLYQDDEGKNGAIQYLPSLPLSIISSERNDNEGPEIMLWQNNTLLHEGTAIIPSAPIKVELYDESGINLMEALGHGIHYAFGEDELTLIPGEEFTYTDCSKGWLTIPVPTTIHSGRQQFYFEAWDGVNNQSNITIQWDILDRTPSQSFNLNKVYPIPNPFSDKTHFTMIVPHLPAEITITVYTLDGEKIIRIEQIATEEFTAIPWNGLDATGRDIPGGAYLYHVVAKTEGKPVFEEIYTLAKIP
jgi:hypothetical protein